MLLADILFNPQGKIRKIKIYLDKDGNRKGDALVTFTKAEHATLAYLKVRPRQVNALSKLGLFQVVVV